MSASPKTGLAIFEGRSGRKYSKQLYFSDVNLAQVNFDSGTGASATSENFWYNPEDVLLKAIYISAQTTDTTQLKLIANGIPTGDVFLIALLLASVNNPPLLAVPLRAGTKIAIIQLT